MNDGDVLLKGITVSLAVILFMSTKKNANHV